MVLATTAQHVSDKTTGRARPSAPVSLARILVALDASDHANRALAEALRLAGAADGTITGIHAYAARLHDRRFRQMEGGLPERYRAEDEMEHQREVHDDLITRGLNVISDSYHDVAQNACDNAVIPYRRLSPEGKNYGRIVDALSGGDFDVLALGAVGLGAVPGGLIGTVCERVVRRSPVDVLVIRDAERQIGDGPIVVGLDGSPLSFGVLKTALDIGRRLDTAVHAVAAYDPYYHYVAFNKISGVLSEEAGKVFRFKEQEKLHEELIDQGIAKIYQSHLDIAERIAADDGTEITCCLLDGKPYKAVLDYLENVDACLLMLGKTGVHADADLDIGGNAENLLRLAPCHIWLGQATFTPPLDLVAGETISWSDEAERRMEGVPETARQMVRMAILRLAQESGHTVITSTLIGEATARFCPHMGGSAEPDFTVDWSDGATRLLGEVGDTSVVASIRLRAEKSARRDGADMVTSDHVRPFLEETVSPVPLWNAAALARLSRVPEMIRPMVRRRIETDARKRGQMEISLVDAEAGLARARESMAAAMGDEAAADGCPFHKAGETTSDKGAPSAHIMTWSTDAKARLEKVPDGFMRDMTRRRIETLALRRGILEITSELMDDKYKEWETGSVKQEMTLDWDGEASARIGRIPDFVRGMVILEVERCAREMGGEIVTGEVIDQAMEAWAVSGMFHSDRDPDPHG